METIIKVENLEFDLSNKQPMNFQDATSLCVDGWRIPTLEELRTLGPKIYLKGNKRELNGHHFRPKLYWSPGFSKNGRGGEIDRECGWCTLYYFDLNYGWYMSPHETPNYLILVKEIVSKG